MLIFGWSGKSKTLGYVGMAYCPHCRNEGTWKVIETSRAASLYFVRVAKWDVEYACVCPVCGRGILLSGREQAQDLLLASLERREQSKIIGAELRAAQTDCSECEHRDPMEMNPGVPKHNSAEPLLSTDADTGDSIDVDCSSPETSPSHSTAQRGLILWEPHAGSEDQILQAVNDREKPHTSAILPLGLDADQTVETACEPRDNALAQTNTSDASKNAADDGAACDSSAGNDHSTANIKHGEPITFGGVLGVAVPILVAVLVFCIAAASLAMYDGSPRGNRDDSTAHANPRTQRQASESLGTNDGGMLRATGPKGRRSTSAAPVTGPMHNVSEQIPLYWREGHFLKVVTLCDSVQQSDELLYIRAWANAKSYRWKPAHIDHLKLIRKGWKPAEQRNPELAEAHLWKVRDIIGRVMVGKELEDDGNPFSLMTAQERRYCGELINWALHLFPQMVDAYHLRMQLRHASGDSAGADEDFIVVEKLWGEDIDAQGQDWLKHPRWWSTHELSKTVWGAYLGQRNGQAAFRATDGSIRKAFLSQLSLLDQVWLIEANLVE